MLSFMMSHALLQRNEVDGLILSFMMSHALLQRNEVDGLMRELRQWQDECRLVEDMRTNALDALRCLEIEVSDLHNTEKDLRVSKDAYNRLQEQVGIPNSLVMADGYKCFNVTNSFISAGFMFDINNMLQTCYPRPSIWKSSVYPCLLLILTFGT
jgi:hypothetical protein